MKKNNRDATADRNLGKQRDQQPESSESIPTGRDATPNNPNEEKQPGSTFFSQGFQKLAINDKKQVGPSNTNDRAGVSSNSASADHPNGAADDDSEMDDATPPPPPPSQTRKLQSQNSRVLRRRKDVLEDANAGEMTIPRPSPELLSQFDEKRKREEDVGKPATGPSHTPEKRRGKRAHGDLSAVPEMADNGSGSGGRIAAMSAENGSADDSGAQPTPSKRRRNAPPSNNATRGKKVKKPTEPAVGVRRSSRNKSASA